MGAALRDPGSIAPLAPWPLHFRLEFSEAAMQDPVRGGEGALVPPDPQPCSVNCGCCISAQPAAWRGCSRRQTGPSWRFFKWRLTTE